MNPIEINTLHGGELYNLLYILAFLTICTFFIFSGLKHKYSFQHLWLIAATGTLFFILGNKFFAISPHDWKNLMADTGEVSHGAKTILGGLVGLIAGNFLVIRWLKLDARVIDFAAIGLPLAMAVTRLGCLFSGCCYGKITDLPWGISYTPGHHAFNDQLACGLIHQHEAISLPVHPVQIYDIICCILIAIIVWKFAGFLKTRGNKLLFAILLYGIARFFLEFFREPITDFYASGMWHGLKYIQWILLGAVILISLFIWFRESNAENRSLATVHNKPWTGRSVLLLFFLALVFGVLFNWFDPLEKTTLSLVLIPAIIMMAWNYAMHYLMRHYRMVTAMSLMFGLLFMGQTYIPENNSTKVSFFEVGAGGLFGKYYSETGQKLWAPATSGGTDCYGDYHPPEPAHYYLGNVALVEHAFRQYGTGASYNVRKGPYNRLSVGMNGFYGVENESYTLTYYDSLGNYISQAYNSDIPLFALNPYFTYDKKSIGVEAGFHVGKFRMYDRTDEPTVEDPENQAPTLHFLPQFGFRFGPQNIIYFDGRYCSAFPTCFPTSKYSLGLASGLGRWNGTKLGAGYGSSGYYSTATIVIKEKLVVDMAFTYDIFNTTSGKNTGSFNIGIHYRFGYRTINATKR